MLGRLLVYVVSPSCSNKTFEDILMHDELQKYADKCSDRFKLWHALSNPPDDKEWPYPTGHLDADLM